MKNIKFVELFAGIGGFRYGLEKANTYKQEIFSKNNLSSKGNKFNSKRGTRRCSSYRCVWANEWDKYAVKIYKKNFGEKPDTRDIRTVKVTEVPNHNLLTAGFPCQAFSIAGHRKGFEDTRGTLFFDIARILNTKRPRFLLLENVRGLLSHDKGRTFKIILSTLNELGYDLQWQVLNSKDFGVPQNRERVFIIGHIRGTPRPEVFPIKKGSKNFNEKYKERDSKSKDTQTITSTYYKGGKGSHIMREQFDISKKDHKSQQDRVYYTDGIMACLPYSRTKTKINIFSRPHGFNKGGKRKYPNVRNSGIQNELVGGIRRLTPLECERLQGFPDNWTEGISDTQRYKCLGNAVTTNVITEIGKRLIKEGI